MTPDGEPCQLVLKWLMALHLEHFYTSSVFMAAKLKKKDRLNLTVMTHDLEPCQVVPIWLMTIPLQHGHTGSVFMVAKLKRQSKPNPNDSRSRTLSVGPNMANASSFRAWSQRQRFYGSQIKKNRLNLTLMTNDREPCQLVPLWLMHLHLENGDTGRVFMVAK